MTAEYQTITGGERVWLETIGGLLGWTEENFLATKYFTNDMTVRQLEQQRVSHISKIRDGLKGLPYIEKQTDIYAEVVTFRASRFIDRHSDVAELTPEDRQKYDDIMELATAVAFTDVSGILSRKEIQKLIEGKKVNPRVRGRDIR